MALSCCSHWKSSQRCWVWCGPTLLMTQTIRRLLDYEVLRASVRCHSWWASGPPPDGTRFLVKSCRHHWDCRLLHLASPQSFFKLLVGRVEGPPKPRLDSQAGACKGVCTGGDPGGAADGESDPTQKLCWALDNDLKSPLV